MSFQLGDYEAGTRFDGDYAAELMTLQNRLAQIQLGYISRKYRAVIVVEGWGASGKGGVIRRLAACWDPRWFDAWPMGMPGEAESQQHFLQRFWQKMPGPGQIAVLDGSWYGRVLHDRVEGFCSEDAWRGAYDEINEFEAQHRSHGTRIVKVFLHVTQATQDNRFKARLRDPHKHWKMGADDFRSRAKRAAYLDAYADMFAHCHTRWAPWTIVDGNHKKTARLTALRAIADQLSAGLDITPLPLDPELDRLAALAFALPVPA